MSANRTLPSGTIRHIESLWLELENQAVHDPVLRITRDQIVYSSMDREQALLGAVLHLAKTVKELRRFATVGWTGYASPREMCRLCGSTWVKGAEDTHREMSHGVMCPLAALAPGTPPATEDESSDYGTRVYERCVCGHPGDTPTCPIDHDQIQHEQDTPQEPSTCAWTEDENVGWTTACGNFFQFNDGTPTENKQAFCGYCGLKLCEVRYVDAPWGSE